MTATIDNSWGRITEWLKQTVPDEFALLQGPVPVEELDAAASEFGVELPGEFRQLYLIANGTNPNGESVGLFPSEDEWEEMAFGPLAVDHILSEWQMQKELVDCGEFADRQPESCDAGIENEWWNVGWIPFAWNGGGDYYCIDLAPAAGGTRGQVITHSHETGEHKVLASSLAEYLSNLADDLEAGKFEYSDYGLQKV